MYSSFIRIAMRNLTMLVAAGLFLTGITSCSEGVEEKKQELKELKTEAIALDKQIAELEAEIASLDSTFGKNTNTNVVQISTVDINPQDFAHRIEVRGTVESRRNVMLSAETAGRVEAVKVQEGDRVNKGQVIVQLDASVIRNNINELKTSLELAETVYKRQKNLWDQEIGTEIQYLEAKNNYESLKSRLNTLYSQLDMAMVRAPFTGRVDELPVRLGEMASPGMPLVRLVSPGEMYIQADVSERFIGRFETGDSVNIRFPSTNQTLVARISNVGDVINKANRTFSVEINLPKTSFKVKPNQVAVLNITDYTTKGALVIPTKLIQRDSEGIFVYRVSNSKGGEKIAEKVHIETGTSYEGDTEVTSGLNKGDVIIDKGSRDVADGVQVQMAKASNATAGL